jgi:hypothetical protein
MNQQTYTCRTTAPYYLSDVLTLRSLEMLDVVLTTQLAVYDAEVVSLSAMSFALMPIWNRRTYRNFASGMLCRLSSMKARRGNMIMRLSARPCRGLLREDTRADGTDDLTVWFDRTLMNIYNLINMFDSMEHDNKLSSNRPPGPNRGWYRVDMIPAPLFALADNNTEPLTDPSGVLPPPTTLVVHGIHPAYSQLPLPSALPFAT